MYSWCSNLQLIRFVKLIYVLIYLTDRYGGKPALMYKRTTGLQALHLKTFHISLTFHSPLFTMFAGDLFLVLEVFWGVSKIVTVLFIPYNCATCHRTSAFTPYYPLPRGLLRGGLAHPVNCAINVSCIL